MDWIWDGVGRITAPNPGPKTLEGTNLYLITRGSGWLIDAGPDDRDFLDELAGLVDGRIAGILLTHDHPDHAGGAGYLGSQLDVPVWMSVKASRDVFHSVPTARTLGPDQAFGAGGTLRAIEMPGHAWDHVCYWLEPDRLLFAGDNILGRGTTLIALPEGDMTAYMETLRKTHALESVAIAPGHGPMIDNPEAKIDEYVQHRRLRERDVLGALIQVDTADEIVDLVYEVNDPAVRALAVFSVGAQLAKLERERKIVKLDDGSYRVRADS